MLSAFEFYVVTMLLMVICALVMIGFSQIKSASATDESFKRLSFIVKRTEIQTRAQTKTTVPEHQTGWWICTNDVRETHVLLWVDESTYRYSPDGAILLKGGIYTRILFVSADREIKPKE